MRQWTVLASACVAAAGCGGDGQQGAKERTAGSGELTVTVPPIPSSEPTVAATAPDAGFETIAVAQPVAQPAPETPKQPPTAPEPAPDDTQAQFEVALAPAPETVAPTGVQASAGGVAAAISAAAPAPGGQPAGAPAWAGYLRKAGFPCQRVASAIRVERPSRSGLQYYRVDCEGGGPYQATNKRGRLLFRRWRG